MADPQGRQQLIGDFIRSKKVVLFRRLRELVVCSELTLRNDIRKVDGITSYTHQRSFVTLREIPKFDKNGVWFFRGVGFTKFENSLDLIVHLIDSSKEGMTREQIQGVMKIKIFQQIQVLLRRKRLNRVKIGNKYVYVPDEVMRNKKKRLRLVGSHQVEEHFESGINIRDLLTVLKVVLLEKKVEMKSIKRWIKKHSLNIPFDKLEQLFLKYNLTEKKTPLR